MSAVLAMRRDYGAGISRKGMMQARNGKTQYQNRLETLDPGPGWLRIRFVTAQAIEGRNQRRLDGAGQIGKAPDVAILRGQSISGRIR
jgi:hypothetical protein